MPDYKATLNQNVYSANIVSSGEKNTGSNLGNGEAIFKEKSGATLRFKTIVSDSDVLSISSVVDEITFDLASQFEAKTVGAIVFDSNTDCSVGDGVVGIPIPNSLNGMNIVDVVAVVHTAGTSNTMSIQVRRRRAGSDVDVLNIPVTIDSAEYYVNDGSIDVNNDDLQIGDMLYIDVDTVHATPAKGLSVSIDCRLP